MQSQIQDFRMLPDSHSMSCLVWQLSYLWQLARSIPRQLPDQSKIASNAPHMVMSIGVESYHHFEVDFPYACHVNIDVYFYKLNVFIYT